MDATQQNILNFNEKLVKVIQSQPIFYFRPGNIFCYDKIKQKYTWLEIFHHEYLYSAYANDTAIFLKDINSVFEKT